MRLQVLPAGAAPGSPEKILEFTRNKVTLEAQAAQKEVRTITRDGKALKVGVITVPGFYQDIAAQNAGDENYRSTTRDVRRLINELKTEKIDGLVLDLRGNGGGYLPEATALTGLFIDHGPVVQLKDTTGRARGARRSGAGRRLRRPARGAGGSLQRLGLGDLRRRHPGLPPRHRSSASAPSARARCRTSCRSIAGRSSPVNGQLTVTIGKFYRVTGESTQHRGVEPDVTAALADRHEGSRRERARSAPCPGIASPACPSTPTSVATVTPHAAHARRRKRTVRAQQGPGLSLAGRRHRRHRHGCASSTACP